MRNSTQICLVSSEGSPWGGVGHALRRLAILLATRHEVTLIQSGGLGPPAGPFPAGVHEVFVETEEDLETTVFSCDDHRRSAAVLRAIERAYGSSGPDYLEVCDYRAHGLVPLQARRAGHPLLADTLIGVKISATSELICLHDGTLYQPGMRLLADLEREQFRLADRLLWRGGDTADLYRRYYSDVALPESFLVRPAFEVPATPPVSAPRDPDAPLRILYVGRLQRCKGALDLVEACLALPFDGWELTMIGADTGTAPLGQSVRMTIEAMCGGDRRLRVEDPLPHDELQRAWQGHDLLVVPSRFEVWSNVALEGMRAGLPVLATPVGGLSELVEPGVTGWHSRGVGPSSLTRALVEVLEEREELERIRASGAIFDRFRRLTDPEEILASYDRLLAPAGARGRSFAAPRPDADAKATAIVPYHRGSAFVEEAVGSMLAQTHREVEVLIVNDGSFEEADDVLDRLCVDPRVSVITQLNRGESSARNLGACLARGDYLVMLDSDNVLEPEFVARAIAMLRAEPELAYVTCWLRHVTEDGSDQVRPSAYAPLGNSAVSDDSVNWDGDTLAVLPRSLFSEQGYRYERTSGLQSDLNLYRTLRDDGRFGAVIPELLARYRVRPDSLTRTHEEEIHDRGREEDRLGREMRAVRWTAEMGVT